MTSLEDALQRVRADGGGLGGVLQFAIEIYQREHLTAASALQVCALPTALDAEIVERAWTVAAGADAQAPSLLPQWEELAFVSRRADGRWVMHEPVRSALLEQLSNQGSGDLKVTGADALAAVFASRADDARARRRAAIESAPALHAGSPARFQDILRRADVASIVPAVEAVSIALARDATSGAAAIRREVEAEVAEANAVALDGLLSSIRQLVEGEGPAAFELELGDGDLRVLINQYEAAENVFRRLAESTEGPALNRVLDRYIRVLLHQSRSEEALEAARKQLANRSPNDWIGRCLSLLKIAGVQADLLSMGAVLETCATLTHDAVSHGRLDFAVAGEGLAALAEKELGHPAEAVGRLVAALHLAYRADAIDHGMVEILVDAALSVTKGGQVEVIDSVLAQHGAFRSLAGSRGWRQLADRLSALATAGRRREALSIALPLIRDLQPSSGAEWAVLQASVSAAIAGKRWQEAIEGSRKVEAGAQAHLSLVNMETLRADRALVHLACGEIKDAERGLAATVASPLIADHPTYGPVCRAALAVVHARRGDVDGARALVATAKSTLEAVSSESLRWALIAEVAELAGDLDSGLEQWLTAARLSESVGAVADAAEYTARGLMLAVAIGEWERAEVLAADASRLIAVGGSLDITSPLPARAVRAAGAMLASLRLDPAGASPVEAAEELVKCHSEVPADWWVGLCAAHAAIDAGLFEQAWSVLEHLDRWVVEAGALPVARILRATVALALAEQAIRHGDGDRGIAMLQEATSIADVELPSGRVERLAVYARVAAGQVDKALERINDVALGAVGELDAAQANLYRHALRSVVAVLMLPDEQATRVLADASAAAAELGLHPYWAVVELISAISLPHQAEELSIALHRLRFTPEGKGHPMSRFTPTVSTLVPEGWVVKESITLMHPNGRANIIVSSEPIDSTLDTSAYAALNEEMLEIEFPGYALVEGGEHILDSGVAVHRRVFSWQPDDGVPVTHIQMNLAREGTGYTATATAVAAEFDEQAVLLSTVLEGIAFGEGSHQAR